MDTETRVAVVEAEAFMEALAQLADLESL